MYVAIDPKCAADNIIICNLQHSNTEHETA